LFGAAESSAQDAVQTADAAPSNAWENVVERAQPEQPIAEPAKQVEVHQPIAEPKQPIEAHSIDIERAPEPAVIAGRDNAFPTQPVAESIPALSVAERANVVEHSAANDNRSSAGPEPGSSVRRFDLPPELVMIETSPESRNAAQAPAPAPISERVQPRRPRHVAATESSQETLEQVETRK
jgi:hypothetical protein